METLEFWYFYQDDCGICHALWPKVEHLLQNKFPQIKVRRLDARQHRELAGQHRMLAVPGLLFFVGGREHFRANGLVTMSELEAKLSPAYEAYFGDFKN